MIHRVLHAFVERGFVETCEVGQVDLQPAQTPLPKGFGICEKHQTTAEVIPDVVKMRWDWIGAPAEVYIVRLEKAFTQELPGG